MVREIIGPTPAVLTGGGEMGALIRAHDWSLTSLGAPETWPQSLRTSLSILLNSKNQMFLAWGSDLTSFYNDACCPLLGTRHPAALGKPLSEIWADTWPAVSPLVDQALSGEATWSEDLPLVTYRNGHEEIASFTFSYSPIRDESGAVAGMFCACTEATGKVRTDVHEQEEAGARLLLYDRSLAAIAQGVTITDPSQPDHPIIYANPAFERITGYPADEVIGRNCRFLQGTETDPITVSRLRAALQQGHAVHETLINYTKLGVPFTNELTIAPVRSPDGSVTHFVGVQSDVTDRQRLEAQLRQSQKMEAVGQLTGGLAHEFNNLMVVIMGNAELLIDEPSDAAQTAALSAVILQAAELGAELTQRLLAFGRRQSLKQARLPLEEAVSGMVPLLQSTLGANIELRTEFVETALSTLTDRTLLESAILNLVVNASDAMPEGGVLTIKTAQRAAGPRDGQLPMGQDVVVVTVLDTGTGMDPDVLSRVFEPFFTTKEVGKGSGLGLAMVHGFAQQSGGHVTVESELGHGTSVSIILPAVVSQPTAAKETSILVPNQKGKERLLVVEDSPQVLQFVSAQLLGLGYDVTGVTDGPKALSVLKRDGGFDLLLTDLMLPRGMSGVDLARAARTRKPSLKVIFTSGYSEDVFEKHGRLDEDTPLLRKPYKRKVMSDMLRQVLDGPAPPHAPAEDRGLAA